MNFDGGTVKYTIEADTSGFSKKLQDLDKEFERLSDDFDNLFNLGVLDEKQIKKVLELQQNMASYGEALENVEEGTEEYNYIVQQADKTLDEFAKTIGETRDAANQAVEPMESLGSSIAKMAGKAGLSAFKGLATGATTALVALAQKGVSATNFLETSQIAMSGLLGSMELGKKAMGVAANFWSNNPFNRFDVTNATKQLVQYGRTVNDLNGDLKILGNVSLSTGMAIDDLALYYGRVASSGRAMTQDIEMMSSRGVPIYRELQRILGTTQQGVRELASQGKIDFETFRQAMEGAINPEAMEQYEETLDRAKDKLNGSITTLAGALAGYKIVNSEVVIQNEGLYRSWIKLLRAIAGSSDEGTGLRNPKIIEGLTKIGQAIASFIDKIADKIEPIMKALGNVLEFIGNHTETLIPIAIGALNVVAGLIGKIPILNSLLGGIGTKASALWSIVKNFASNHKVITSIIAIVTTGLFTLMKNDEEFKQSLQELFSSLIELGKNLLPVIQTLFQAFMSLAQSGIITGGLKLIVGLVSQLARILAETPVEVLSAIAGVILAVKLSSVNPWLVWITAIGLVISYIKELAPSFYEAAHNAIIGFVNGIVEGARTAVNAVISLGRQIIQAFRNVLGIHSPSVVMYGLGQQVGIGLANGISDSSSIVNTAMDNLAKDVLNKAEKVIGNMSSFGLLDYNGVYKQWRKIANIFTIGSEQYEQAISKMEDARKNVNLEILKLQNEYNDALDASIKKIQSMYGLFDEVSTKGGKSSTQIIKNLDKQLAQTKEWSEAQKKISKLGLAEGLKKELKEMGVESVSELSSIANMTASELQQLNELWLEKQDLATTASVEQLADYREDVLSQVEKLSDGIDGETIKLREEGGRLVSSIGEGITGALPTLADSLSQLNSYIAEAASKATSTGTGNGKVEDDDYDPNEALADIFNPEDITNKIKEKLSQIDWKSIIPWLLAGLVGGSLLKNALGSIDWGSLLSGGLSKAKDLFSGGSSGIKNSLSGIGSKIKGLFGSSKKTLDVGSHVDLSGINKTSASLTSAGKSMSKLDKVYLAIAKGAAIILLIAADIWAIAKAIRYMYDALDGMEWGSFGSKLGMMAAAIAAFALLDGILGIKPIAAAVAIGGAVMLEIAIDIAAIARAIKEMDENVPEDIDHIRPKLEIMVETIGAFTILSAIDGLLAPLIGFGAIAVVTICKEIQKVAETLKFLDDTIPTDYSALPGKVDLIKSTIEKITEANLGQVISAIVTSWSVLPVITIAQMYEEVAKNLGKIGSIEIDTEQANANIEYIKETIEKLKTETNVIAGALNALRQAAEADTVEQSARILIIYGQVVDSLNKIASLDVKQEDITKGIAKIEACISAIDTSMTVGAFLSLFGVEDHVEKAKNIIEDFGAITPVLNELAKEENKVETETIKSVIDDMDTIFEHMKTKLVGMGNFSWQESNTEKVKNIIEDFDGICKTAKSLLDEDHKFDVGDENSGLTKQITDISTIIKLIQDKLTVKQGFGTVEKQMGEVQSVVNKFSELSLEWKKQLSKDYAIDNETYEKIKTNIEQLRNLVWEVEQINTSGFNDIDKKVKVVESAKTIAEKFSGFVETMQKINTDNMADAKTLTDTAYQLMEGVKTGISDKIPDMENLGKELTTAISSGVNTSYDQLYATGAKIQSAIWNGLNDKFADEYQQGIYLAYQVRDGIWSVVPQFERVGADIQSSLWWGIQNKMGDEYQQGIAMGLQFRQGLYDVDYANSGWWAVQGFINGAYNRGYYSGGDSVYWVGWNIANEFLKGLKKRADEHSPWKTTEQSGKFAVQGLIDGMQSLEGEVIDEAEVLADGIINALDLSDTTLSPTLAVNTLSPSSGLEEEYGYTTSGRDVVVNMNNNVYTDVDMEQVERDLSYSLSQI